MWLTQGTQCGRDHASPGVAWLQTSVTPAQAVLTVKTEISNGTQRRPDLTLVASVLDAGGKCVASSEEKIAPTPDAMVPDSLRVVVSQPHLWTGRIDPYLYRVVVELRSTNGVTLQKDLVAQFNSPVVDNLLKAGAIILGRTNTPASAPSPFAESPPNS